ncbi:MAG: sigma-70 family RNA polymerase sigma factor [Candidatus Marinimicrobia bacterium]|nr:sigma-70 family RNA polymerase sigma factor [Candidatus Neomarinimicrobiota bacterium]MBL7009712.1 sigma-70 family RNA polymerase sigma factor [Candidatus Neomarinimicrobiota bacterium]MBL7029545.1 sigma-70 family RNA polymerase sigma factor [Candidatus Neomarinimicrobiota bacterium]
MKTPEYDETHLVEKAKAGDEWAIASIVEQQSHHIYNLALRLMQNQEDAEDVLQETFLIFIDKIQTFKGASSIGTWLYRIGTNVALGKLRAKDYIDRDISIHDPGFESLKGYEIRNWPDHPENELDPESFHSCLKKALKELSEDYRIVFVLRDLEGVSTNKTAEILNISVSNVKVRLMRARLFLRDQLAKKLKCVEKN